MGRIYYIIGDYDRATEFLNRALTLSRKIGDKNTEAAILNNIGQIFKNIADYDKAIDYIEKAIEIYNDTGFIKGLIVSKSSQAAIFYQYGKYHHSLKLWEECLPIAEEHNKELIGYLLNNISQVYRVLGNKNKALSLLEVSLAMQEELGDEEGMATTLNNIAAIYYVDGDVIKARKFFGKSLAFRQKSGSKAAFAAALSNLGQVYSSKKNYHLASKLLKQSLKLNRKIGDFTGLIPTLHNLSLIALEQKDMNKYFEQHEEAWRIASQIKDTTGIVNVGRILGPNLIEAGKVDEGLQILKTVYAVSKQSNLPNTEEIEHLIKKYED
jgi:tetratricopeptide (TPR) repeat protein